MSYLNKILVGVLLVFIVGCANDYLEVSDNNSFQLYEFDVPAISSQPGEYEINFEFPKSEALIITGQPENIWRIKDNILTLDLDVARDNKIEKAQFHIKIKEGSEEDEYAIVTPKITVKIDDEDYDKLDIKLGPENKAAFAQTIVYSVPMGPMMFWGIIIGTLLLLAAITYLLLRKMEVIGPKTFKMGRLSFLSDGAPVPSVELAKLENLSLQKYYSDLEGVILVPIDRLNSKRRKMRMANMKISNSGLKIKVSNGTHSETLFGNTILYHMDRIEIETANKEKIIIEYTNSKNPKI